MNIQASPLFPGMTPELRDYLDFDVRTADGGYEEHRRLRQRVEPAVLLAHRRETIDAAFVQENEASRREHRSPSGKYRLRLSSFGTKPGCWSYVRGQVFAVDSDTLLATVNRNYSSFPFTWIEAHPNGHDYLVCGEDYQGQTVLELDTGGRRDHLPEEAYEGHGFCWSDVRFEASTQLLVVSGCHWACPYEYRFYDFAEPLAGWPCLEGACIDVDERAPTFEADGTIQTYQTVSSEDDTEDADDTEKPRILVATQVFRRDGLQLVYLHEIVTEAEAEQTRRATCEENQRQYEHWLATYKATDALYLRSLVLLKEAPFDAEDSISIGQTYEGWCPTWKGQERRICRRILYQGRKTGFGCTLDLEIAHLTGPVKLVVFKEGKTLEERFFDHSIAGVEAAFAYARGCVV